MRVQDQKFLAALLLAVICARQIFLSQNAAPVHDQSDLSSPVPSSSLSSKTDGATFLGMELEFVQSETTSVIHCVGENFLPKLGVGYRSCQFRNLCWDVQDREFVLVQSEQYKQTYNLLNQMTSQYARTSFSFNTTVSLAGTNEAWLRQQGNDQSGWFPRTVSSLDSKSKGFYQLPHDVVVVPVQFPEDMQKKEVLFDFFLPIYNLLMLFDLQGKRLLLANLRPSCPAANQTKCYKEAMYFMPLMNQDANLKGRFMTMDADLEWSNDNYIQSKQPQSNRICSAYGAAGIGALTDHGIYKKSHGERKKDYTFVQNSGRGPLLFEFRKHLLKNAALSEAQLNNNLPLEVTVIISESKKSGIQDFQKQVQAIRQRFPEEQATIQTYNMSEMPLREQLELVSRTNIYVSVMGNGAAPAFFLPRGATFLLFYNDNDEFVSVSKREQVTFPIKLDWDLWNNLAYLRLRWLPLRTKDDSNDLNELFNIIDTEIHALMEKQAPADPPLQQLQLGEPGGVFNGMDLKFVNRAPKSSVHCVGDNFQEGAHVLRSCEFRFLCLDLGLKDRNFSLYGSSRSTDMAVSLGQTIRFSEDSDWFPLVEGNASSDGFYELESNVVWAPFYAEQPNINNPGHLLWDYFLPLFNLLAMFGLEGSRLLVSNVDDGCTPEESSPCWGLISKFLPLIGVNQASFRNVANSELKTKGPRRSNLVCARRAVAGIGMLTDHGWNRHGQRIEDYRDSHNVGRGPLFFAFRSYVIKLMGIQNRSVEPPYKVIFSTHSSKNPARRLGFQKQIQALRSSFSSEDIVVEEHILAELTLKKQVALATETFVFISVVGGSACTATFLPRGSTVVLFFNDVNEFADHAPRKDFPSMIDWDFWNNASYLRVHWLPIRTMDEEVDLKVLTEIIRSDLFTLKSMQ